MVKTINMRFDNETWAKIQIKKIQLGVRKHQSLSWEEFMLLLCKIE